jgi:hypothetical protein
LGKNYELVAQYVGYVSYGIAASGSRRNHRLGDPEEGNLRVLEMPTKKQPLLKTFLAQN